MSATDQKKMDRYGGHRSHKRARESEKVQLYEAWTNIAEKES